MSGIVSVSESVMRMNADGIVLEQVTTGNIGDIWDDCIAFRTASPVG